MSVSRTSIELSRPSLAASRPQAGCRIQHGAPRPFRHGACRPGPRDRLDRHPKIATMPIGATAGPTRSRQERASGTSSGGRMVTIESTPEMAAKVYDTMARTLERVRRRLGRPLTLADKVLLGHLDDPDHQDMEPGKSYLQRRPDRVVLQDVLGQTAMLQFMQTRRDAVAVPTSVHCDHLIQARVEGQRDLRESLEENQEVYNFLRSAAA